MGNTVNRARPTPRRASFVASLLLLAAAFAASASGLADIARSGGGYVPPRTRPAFEQEFLRVFSASELAAALPLFYWRGMDTDSKQVIYGLIRNDLAKTPVRMNWLPAGDDAERQRVRRQRYQSNLPVIARLLVEFTDADGRESVSVHDIGISDGVYYIVLFEPVPVSA